MPCHRVSALVGIEPNHGAATPPPARGAFTFQPREARHKACARTSTWSEVAGIKPCRGTLTAVPPTHVPVTWVPGSVGVLEITGADAFTNKVRASLLPLGTPPPYPSLLVDSASLRVVSAKGKGAHTLSPTATHVCAHRTIASAALILAVCALVSAAAPQPDVDVL